MARDPFASYESKNNQRKSLNNSPTNHASADDMYGVGDDAKYGHVKITSLLTRAAKVTGEALSSYAGYLLNYYIEAVKTRCTDLEKRMTSAENGITTLNGNLGKEYWSEPTHLMVANANAWQRSEKSLVLPSGNYMIGFKAEVNCDNLYYIDAKIDTYNGDLNLFEKSINIPMSSASGQITKRTVTVTSMLTLYEQKTLYFYTYASRTSLDIMWEIYAKRLKA